MPRSRRGADKVGTVQLLRQNFRRSGGSAAQRFGDGSANASNPARDRLRESLPIAGGLHVAGFKRARQETAFHQDRRDGGAAEDEIAPSANPAIFGGRGGDHVAMNVGGETSAVAPVIVGLNA